MSTQTIDANTQGRAAEIANLRAVIEAAQYPDQYDGMFGLPTAAQRAVEAQHQLDVILAAALEPQP